MRLPYKLKRQMRTLVGDRYSTSGDRDSELYLDESQKRPATGHRQKN